jgi:VanZ family protein
LTLAAVLAAEALYPFVVTLDVSTVWGNVKSGQWRPFGTFARDFWPDVLVEKFFVYAAAGALARGLLEARGPGGAGLLAWTGSVAFALALESFKPLIVGRAPNVDGVVLAGLGGLLGVTVLPALARAPVVRAHARAWVILSAAALLAYEEMTPFSLVASGAVLPGRLARVEWVPFAAYYGANLQSALFDFGKKIVLGGAVGAAMRYASPRPRLVLVLVGAALLEAVQILQPVHTPSTTDALTCYGGALLGSYLLERSGVAGPDEKQPGTAV